MELGHSVANSFEGAAWRTFKGVITDLLVNFKAENHEPHSEDFLFLQSHGMYNAKEFSPLNSYHDFFPTNCSPLSKMYGESFHQRISIMKKRYQVMLAHSCWGVISSAPWGTYKHESSLTSFLFSLIRSFHLRLLRL
jgi:hypothetical protein